jgi:hypothetical protein
MRIRRMFAVSSAVIIAAFFLSLAGPLCANNSGENPAIPVPEGGFEFLQGAWSSYRMKSLSDGREFEFKVSVLEPGSYRRREGRWLEIKISSEQQPAVLTRILAEETGSGPGEILQAVVQVEGMDAFTVPAAFLRGKEEPRFKTFDASLETEEDSITWEGKELDVIRTEGEDEDGNPFKIILSPDAPPLSVVYFESADIIMSLLDWGPGAETEISGRVRGFFSWLISRIRIPADR